MRDFELATAVALEHEYDGGRRRYTGTLHEEWGIWGPMGGYIGALGLRAAGDASPFRRGASFACQFLQVGAFGEVEIDVTPLRAGRIALMQQIDITQGAKHLLHATMWSVDEIEGLAHDTTPELRPRVRPPSDLLSHEELRSDEDRASGSRNQFWNNFDTRPVDQPGAVAQAPAAQTWREWLRFLPQSTFPDNGWVDLARSLVLLDLQSWLSGSRDHPEDHGYVAPSLDLYVAFHDPSPDSAWLLADGRSPIAKDGLIGWTGRLWTEGGSLVASAAGQLLCRSATR